MLFRLLGVIFLINILCLAFWNISSAQDNVKTSGKEIFQNCSGCHFKGQNLIKQDKPIIGSSKLKSKETFRYFISAPPKPMPNFKHIADNKEKLNALYNYVSSLR